MLINFVGKFGFWIDLFCEFYPCPNDFIELFVSQQA